MLRKFLKVDTGKDSANEKPWTLFTIALPTPLPWKTYMWLAMVADTELQFPADPK